MKCVGFWNRLKSPISAATVAAVTTCTPRSAWSAFISGNRGEISAALCTDSVSRATRAATSSTSRK